MSKIFVSSFLEIPDETKFATSSRRLQKTLEECYNKQLFVDAEIRIQGKLFRAHRCILAFYSPIFQKVFYSAKMPPSVCVINDVTPKGFSTLLRYIYSSKISTQVNANYLTDAFAAAKTLEMIGIKDKLTYDIFQKTTLKKPSIVEEHFWSLLERSHLLNLTDLKQKLLIFAKDLSYSLFNHAEFLKTGSQTIKLVLNLNNFSVPERDILERIAHWKDSNSNLEFLDETVQDLLSCINFERLSPNEFYSVVSKYDKLIPVKDALDILMHLVDHTASSLPKWCHLNGRREISELYSTSSNMKTFNKTENFKALEDLTKISNLTSVKDSQSLHAFQSQKKESKSVEDWRDGKLNIEKKSYTKTLSESFWQMLHEGLFTDIILSDCNGVKTRAHRLILASRSHFFANLLYGPTSTSILELEETADELKWMLRYFYGKGERMSKLMYVSLNEVLRKFDLSLKYTCHPLIQECMQTFNSTPVTQNIFWKLLSDAYQPENYKINTEHLIKYAVKSSTNIFTHEDFYSADETVLSYILNNDYLNISEYDKLEYIARWLEMNSNKFDSYQSKREILKYVRFGELEAKQFFEFLKMHEDLIVKEDAFAILKCLFENSTSNLPEWCNRAPSRNLPYDIITKIGSDIPISWKSSPMKGMISFRCVFTATIPSSQTECHIQFLELSWKVKPNKTTGKHMDHKCNIIIKCDNLVNQIFNDIDVSQCHRIIVPIFFRINSKKPTSNFEIEVNTKCNFKYYFIDEKKLVFENVVIESNSSIFFITDAIVDNYTSERILVSKDLRAENFNTIITTENFVKLINV